MLLARLADDDGGAGRFGSDRLDRAREASKVRVVRGVARWEHHHPGTPVLREPVRRQIGWQVFPRHGTRLEEVACLPNSTVPSGSRTAPAAAARSVGTPRSSEPVQGGGETARFVPAVFRLLPPRGGGAAVARRGGSAPPRRPSGPPAPRPDRAWADQHRHGIRDEGQLLLLVAPGMKLLRRDRARHLRQRRPSAAPARRRPRATGRARRSCSALRSGSRRRSRSVAIDSDLRFLRLQRIEVETQQREQRTRLQSRHAAPRSEHPLGDGDARGRRPAPAW